MQDSKRQRYVYSATLVVFCFQVVFCGIDGVYVHVLAKEVELSLGLKG